MVKKRTTGKLVLHSETIRTLSPSALRNVVGGGSNTYNSCSTDKGYTCNSNTGIVYTCDPTEQTCNTVC
jgi:hypothetical protein